MNEELINNIVIAIKEESFSLDTLSYILIAIISVLSATIGAFVASYTKEKGKNYATREDFTSLLEQTKATTKETEDIKSEISKLGWRENKQWDLRFKVYSEVLESLAEWRVAIGYVIDTTFDKDGEAIDLIEHDLKDEMDIIGKKVKEIFSNLAKIESISEIVLSADQANRIRELKITATIGAQKISGIQAFTDTRDRIIQLEKEISKEAKYVLFDENG